MLADAFPDASSEELVEKAKAVQNWRQKSALRDCKLVSVTSSMPQDSAMHAVEAIIGAISCSPVKTEEVHGVKPSLLLAPLPEGVETTISIRSPDIGEWVACMSADGGSAPPFGAYGVVIAVHDGFADIRTLEKFPGGSDLDGRVQSGYGCRLPFRVLLSLTTIDGPDVGALAASVMSAGHPPPSGPRSSSRPGPVTAAAIAEPAIPDGTRGFHQQGGHGRGRPLVEKSAASKMTAGPAHQDKPAQIQSAGVKQIAPGPHIPDFFQKLLGGPTLVPQANAVGHPSSEVVEASNSHTTSVQPESEPAPVPDFLQKLLDGPTIRGRSVAQEQKFPSQQTFSQLVQNMPNSELVDALIRPRSARTPAVDVPDPRSETDAASVAVQPATGQVPAVLSGMAAQPQHSRPRLPLLYPKSHEEFSRMTRQQQTQAALGSMKELVSVIQAIPGVEQTDRQASLANVLAKVRRHIAVDYV